MIRRLAPVALALLLFSVPGIGNAAPAGPLTSAPRFWTLGGQPCELIPTGVPASGAMVHLCPGVRPGARVNSDGGGCTFNFMWRGYRYDELGNRIEVGRFMGTAGHCILGDAPGSVNAEEASWEPGEGPEARDANEARIGKFAYAVLNDTRDFALIRLDPGVSADPQMCEFGGPTGTNSDRPTDPTIIEHYGNGVGTGEVLPGRQAVANGMTHPDHVYAWGHAIFGDSGSGSITQDGRAVGVVVAIGLATRDETSPTRWGHVIITRFGPQVARAQEVLDLELELQTAPLL